MNATAEKITSQAMALPVKERAMLAHRLIASLDPQIDAEAKAEWEEAMIKEIRAKLHAARRQAS